jgi:hypothetical protein
VTPDWDEDNREHNSKLQEAPVQFEEVQEFIFTFGVGHKLVAYLPEMHGEVEPQEGISLSGSYVKIAAFSEIEAREAMIKKWGHNWSSCYTRESIAGQQAVRRYKQLKVLNENR